MKRKSIKKGITLLLAAVLAASSLGACARRQESETEGLQVVTTVFASYDFVRQLSAGTDVQAQLLLPPGTEVHSFEPTAQDIIRVQNCDLLIYVGGENDAWVERILSSLPQEVRTLKLLDCVTLYQEEHTEGMQTEEDEEQHGEQPEWDEHVWTDPQNAAAITRKIAEILCRLDAPQAQQLQSNCESYTAQLEELDETFREIVAGAKRRTLLFADRFPLRYFTEAYGLTYYAAFPGCSADSEPSAATVAFLIDKIRQEQLPAVFHIELSSQRLADAICQDTGAQKLLFHSCHNVSQEDFEAGATYLSLMEANAEALRIALC